MYLILPVIVIVLSTMFIPLLWTELKDKHCQDHYNYDRKIIYKVRPFIFFMKLI